MDNLFYMLFKADNTEITWWAMSFRGVLTIFLAIIMIKIGGKTMFGKQGSFDIVASIILGTLLARGITGNADYISTLITALVLVIIHRLIGIISYHHRKLGKFLKGSDDLLIKDGTMLNDSMRRLSITENDLMEALRSQGKINDISNVKEAYLERSGKISVVPK